MVRTSFDTSIFGNLFASIKSIIYRHCIDLCDAIAGSLVVKNWLNYHHLLYFKLIAEHGSVSKAAEILRVGPTASATV